ncbi:MAG: ABC transporter permease [Acidimicrobiia bacterium]
MTTAVARGAGSRTAPRRRGHPALRVASLYVPTLVVVVALVFALPRAMPGDPLSVFDDPDSGVFLSDAESRQRILDYYGLDAPLAEQFARYVSGVARGDLGWSIARNAPVSDLIRQHLPWTLLLMGTSLVLAAAASFVAGVASAWRRGRAADRGLLVSLTAMNAVPEYAIAAVLLIVFAVVFPVLPLYGARSPFSEARGAAAVADVAEHLVLPAAALTLSLLGTKFLLVRNTVLSSLGQDYMLLARAKGLPERTMKYHHAGRNALLPFVTVLGIQAGFAAGGSVFVESVFSYPGMGTLILRAVDARDYPVLEASFLVLAVVVLVVNFALDLLYTRLDPRVAAE